MKNPSRRVVLGIAAVAVAVVVGAVVAFGVLKGAKGGSEGGGGAASKPVVDAVSPHAPAAVAGAGEKGAAVKAEVVTKAFNTHCPLSGEDVSGEFTREFEGKTVAFCCASCRSKFDKMEHAKQVEAVAKAK